MPGGISGAGTNGEVFHVLRRSRPSLCPLRLKQVSLRLLPIINSHKTTVAHSDGAETQAHQLFYPAAKRPTSTRTTATPTSGSGIRSRPRMSTTRPCPRTSLQRACYEGMGRPSDSNFPLVLLAKCASSLAGSYSCSGSPLARACVGLRTLANPKTLPSCHRTGATCRSRTSGWSTYTAGVLRWPSRTSSWLWL